MSSPDRGVKAMDKMAVARALRRLADRVEQRDGKRLTPHDLRKTFRTLVARLGVLPHIAELCLNHQERETMRRVYDGHDYAAETTEAWNRAGAHLQGLGLDRALRRATLSSSPR
jgi:integrase